MHDMSKPQPAFGAIQRGGFGCPRTGFGVPSSSGIQQHKQEDQSVQSQRYSSEVSRSETKSEPCAQSAAGESQSKIIVDQFVEYVNLDAKCDVSVREEGHLRLFTAAAAKIFPTRPARNIGLKHSLYDPEGKMLSVGQETDEEIRKLKQTTRVYTKNNCMVGSRGDNDSDLMFNKGLPEVCPW